MKCGKQFDNLFEGMKICAETTHSLSSKNKEINNQLQNINFQFENINSQLKNVNNFDIDSGKKLKNFDNCINEIMIRLTKMEKVTDNLEIKNKIMEEEKHDDKVEKNKDENKNESQNKNKNIKDNKNKIIEENEIKNKDKNKNENSNIKINFGENILINNNYSSEKEKKEKEKGIFDLKLANEIRNLKPGEILKLTEPKYILVTKKNT